MKPTVLTHLLLAALVAVLAFGAMRMPHYTMAEFEHQPVENARMIWRINNATGAMSSCVIVLDKNDGDNFVCSKDATELGEKFK